MTDIKVIKQDYHRNGVGGDGFVVSLVEWQDAALDRTKASRIFVAVSFPGYEGTPKEQAETFRRQTAVLNVSLLAKGVIEMFPVPGDDPLNPVHGNAWRGADRVGPAVTEAWRTECRSGRVAYDPFDPNWTPAEEEE